jgi:hypothetical protein
MRALLAFLALFAAALGLVALATPAAWHLVSLLGTVPFHRVGNRLAMVGLAAGLWLLARWLRLNNRQDMGYGGALRPWLRQLGVGLLLGLAFMLPLTLLMLATGLRRLNVDLNALLLLKLLLSGLTSGLVVALIEESFLRGAMYSAVTRESGALPAVISTSLLYAATHFFARFTILPADVGPGSGVDLVLGSLRAFAAPAQMADAYLCLTAVGVLLAWVRRQTGNIAAGIGLHAGWVTLMLVTLRISERDEHAAAGWLLSEHDGFVGWLTLAWTLLAAIPVLRYYQRQHPQRAPAPASAAA